MTGTMLTLPLPPALGATDDDATRVRDALLFDHGVEAQIHPGPGGLWTRVSAQIYNDRSDVERLAGAVIALR
jgi:isopenicillin-N epimerase